MSKLNIKGLVDNIKAKTNVYTPIIEAIVNSIQAIDDTKRTDGEIIVTIIRSSQNTLQLDKSALPEIKTVKIEDNGAGFNKINRDSFDTLYSDNRKSAGGKGFGRFMFQKYFTSTSIQSIYKEDNKYFLRKFDFGSNSEIIENEIVTQCNSNDTKTIVILNDIVESKLEKKLDTLARKLLEKLLIYFINDNYNCPRIILKEEGKTEHIILNEYLESVDHPEIQQVASDNFTLLKDEDSSEFQIKIFRIFHAHNQNSKISLTAHNREVTETPLHNYVPEFEDDFFEEFYSDDGQPVRKDYILKAYVLGNYLDAHVLRERGGFEFSTEPDLLLPFSQSEIEAKTAEIVKSHFADEVKIRSEKKEQKIREYVADSPWYKDYLDDLDVSKIPYNLSDEVIEGVLHKAKFEQERAAKSGIYKILEDPNADITEAAQNLVLQISKAQMSELAHYVALRKTILNIFERSLEVNTDGSYDTESAVHNIIFPTRSDSDSTPYAKHNLWILDEKLNFTEYVSSDKPLNGGTSERTDILVFDRKMAFRGENEASNPITIFEFKRPQRDDFVNPSSNEDPVEQIIRYVNDIKDGKYKTPEGRNISIGENTPFYGYVVCDLTNRVRNWLLREKDFTPMPDNEGWFQWFKNNNLYIEVMSWDKLLKDAEMRNKIFFHKLGI